MKKNFDLTEKRCTRCDKVLPITEFKINDKYKDGYTNWCNMCQKEYQKEYYNKNKDAILSKQKEYYETNKEAILIQQKEHYEDNKESKSIRSRQYYENNKEVILANNKEYYARVKDDPSYKEKRKERDRIQYQKNKQERQEKQRRYYYMHQEQRKAYQREYQKEYYKKNKDKVITYVCEYQKKHPEIQKFKRERRKIREESNNYSQDQWHECMEFFDNKCAYSGETCLPYDADCISDSITVDHIISLSQGGLNVIWNVVPAKFKYNSSKGKKSIEDWYPQQEFFSENRLDKIFQWAEYAYNKYGKDNLNI